jgi:DNA-binding MarR family transcriptional regulator
MTTLPQQLTESSVFLLAKAYQRAHGLFKKMLKPYGITNIQHLVLSCLEHDPGITAAELGKVLLLDKATLSGVIDRLADGGWVIKKKDPEDNRVQRLYITDKTNAVADKFALAPEELDNILLDGLSQEEQVLLKRLLKNLIW